jgi:3-phosphoshikimate 1-carboxyvinyltransferase
MSEQVSISHISKQLFGTIDLPGSKSESNRILIINALSGNASKVTHLSPSNDTKTMMQALESNKTEIDVFDAGTAMRFLIAYFAVTKQNRVITGTKRMLQRPVGHLVEALNSLGANIEYINKPGFPPIKINGDLSIFKRNKIKIQANISSQFISAILMIAPLLPYGLEIELDGNISSIPYIEMTRGIMRNFGIISEWHNNTIIIKKQDYIPAEYTIESDWSNAACWYSMAALSEDTTIFLKGLKRNSFQGDAIIKEWLLPFGVITEFSDTGAFITKDCENLSKLPAIIDFSANPDLAQTMIVLCAAKGASCKFTGLESLRIKETDRIQALQNELIKFNISLVEDIHGIFNINGTFNSNAYSYIESYNDHRMAMAFAPLALKCGKISINNPYCVKKSYPALWEDIEITGFLTEHTK